MLQTPALQALQLIALAVDPPLKDHLPLQRLTAGAHGGFDAPAIWVDDIVCRGRDRLDFVREALST